MDRLTSMAAFVTAVESGSFAKAAERLSLSPQMVAKHVVALEQRLGASLLNRTTRRQSLTALGSNSSWCGSVRDVFQFFSGVFI